MIENLFCKFDVAWVGRCKNFAPTGGYCQEHSTLKCVSCGKQATHDCAETIGRVCGAPLCDDCEHTVCDNGCNSGGALPPDMKDHCKKTEQVNKPWYVKEEKPVKLVIDLSKEDAEHIARLVGLTIDSTFRIKSEVNRVELFSRSSILRITATGRIALHDAEDDYESIPNCWQVVEYLISKGYTIKNNI